jgi:hypothetical protein
MQKSTDEANIGDALVPVACRLPPARTNGLTTEGGKGICLVRTADQVGADFPGGIPCLVSLQAGLMVCATVHGVC